MFRLFTTIFDLSLTIIPFHLLGLKGLIGEIAIFFESKSNIGTCTDKLYAVLPAGVEKRTPSHISFLIIFLLFVEMLIEAACLLCLNIETSLIAIDFFILLFFLLHSFLMDLYKQVLQF